MSARGRLCRSKGSSRMTPRTRASTKVNPSTAIIAKPSVERFDRRVVGRFSTATEVQNDLVRVGPEIHRGADDLRAVVAIDPLRQPALEPQALERRRHVLTPEPLTGV